MKTLDLREWTKGLLRHKYVLLVLLLGLLLLLLPRSGKGTETAGTGKTLRGGEGDPLAASGISLERESERLEELLSAMDGVGEARVLLSAEGAVVVCRGARDPLVRLNVTEALRIYTGLGSDRVRVLPLANAA